MSARQASAEPSATTPPVPPTPTLAQQIVRAQRVGPGFLDYCPHHTGRAPAKYWLSLPRYPEVHGWCETVARRAAHNDLITFRAYWDAHAVNHTSGTLTLEYAVPRQVEPRATPVPQLISQSGSSPL